MGNALEHWEASYDRVLLWARDYWRTRVRQLADFEDRVADTIALIWANYSELDRKGRQPWLFIESISRYACLHVKAGRKLGGRRGTRDVLSPYARERGRVRVTALDRDGTSATDRRLGSLTLDRHADPAALAAFRIDFPLWLETLTRRQRDVVDCLLSGDNTKEAAHHLRVTPAFISQNRRTLMERWTVFTA